MLGFGPVGAAPIGNRVIPKRRNVMRLGVVGLILICLADLWRSTRDFHVSPETYDRLKGDMTEAQVEAIMGKPTTGPSIRGDIWWRQSGSSKWACDPKNPRPIVREIEWRGGPSIIGSSMAVIVSFDQGGRLVSTETWIPANESRQSLFTTIRRWLGF
jgi:hypothetical protein